MHARARQLLRQDEDVRAERARVSTAACDDNIKVMGLRKVFPGTGGFFNPSTPPKVAVQDLCVGIAAGECFGLLGPNGAGKSTTMRCVSLCVLMRVWACASVFVRARVHVCAILLPRLFMCAFVPVRAI